ncbi:MAG TPA: translation initiation factor IF-2 [Candidatus Saccharimonadales bacterium]|nr:translation initiation factor IF-2 [Candidatus Saccharimonadales bacterium]
MASKQQTNTQTNVFPPVVAVLGHVDHGKTSLLDAIRKTNIASREQGGITQKIGASTIEIMHDNQKRKITFIDTPGHEAFTKMRGRGAQVADICLLIVAVDDGVKPQTKESIEIIKSANIPYIVVLTKADVPDKNPEKVKQQIVRENILLEGYGGDIPVIEVSSRTGSNIKELLDLILLVMDVHPLTNKSAENPLEAVIIESKQDAKVGPKATVVIKNGSIHVKDELLADTAEAKVRALITDSGAQVQTATVGDAVELLGFKDVPRVGSIVLNKTSSSAKVTADTIKSHQTADENALSLILCADTQGSLEAIINAMPKNIRLISQKTGDISEVDVLFAKSTGAIILTFNVKLKPEVIRSAINEKVLLKNYTIIYELLEELGEVVEGKRLALLEQVYGVAQILASFPFEKSQVLGISIMEGRMARGDKIRLMRGEEIIGETNVVSLRQGKETTSKVEKGQEAGILISPFLDFKIGDLIIAHS